MVMTSQELQENDLVDRLDACLGRMACIRQHLIVLDHRARTISLYCDMDSASMRMTAGTRLIDALLDLTDSALAEWLAANLIEEPTYA